MLGRHDFFSFFFVCEGEYWIIPGLMFHINTAGASSSIFPQQRIPVSTKEDNFTLRKGLQALAIVVPWQMSETFTWHLYTDRLGVFSFASIIPHLTVKRRKMTISFHILMIYRMGVILPRWLRRMPILLLGPYNCRMMEYSFDFNSFIFTRTPGVTLCLGISVL